MLRRHRPPSDGGAPRPEPDDMHDTRGDERVSSSPHRRSKGMQSPSGPYRDVTGRAGTFADDIDEDEAPSSSAQAAYDGATLTRDSPFKRPPPQPASTAARTRSGENYRSEAAARRSFSDDDDPFISHHVPLQRPQQRGRGDPRDPDDVVDNYIPVAEAPTGIDALPRGQRRVRKRDLLDLDEQVDAFEARHKGRAAVLELVGDAEAEAERNEVLGDRGVAVSASSPLGHVIAPPPLKSRMGKNSWNTARDASPSVLEDIERRSSPTEFAKSEAHYSNSFVRLALDHHLEAPQYSVSTYSKKPLYVDGVFGYHDFLTRREEKDMLGELVLLLKNSKVAAYQPEEGRHCVNLFERELGLATQPDRPLTFAMEQAAPVTTAVLERAFGLGLIPSMPNCVQVSEYVTPYGGYKPHTKHPSIGKYLGLMSLAAQSVLVMQHLNQPWTPQLLVPARSMYVINDPALFEYRIGYPDLDRQLRAHKQASRHTKDYRVELLFATVDAPQVPALQGAVKMTEASDRKLQQLAKELEAVRESLRRTDDL